MTPQEAALRFAETYLIPSLGIHELACMLEQAIRAEREACATVARKFSDTNGYDAGTSSAVAAAICGRTS